MEFIFDNHTLDTERRELLRGGAAIAVQPQVFDLLAYLMQNRERVVSKDDLIALARQRGHRSRRSSRARVFAASSRPISPQQMPMSCSSRSLNWRSAASSA